MGGGGGGGGGRRIPRPHPGGRQQRPWGRRRQPPRGRWIVSSAAGRPCGLGEGVGGGLRGEAGSGQGQGDWWANGALVCTGGGSPVSPPSLTHRKRCDALPFRLATHRPSVEKLHMPCNKLLYQVGAQHSFNTPDSFLTYVVCTFS